MPKPSSKAAVHHEGDEDDRVDPEGHSEEAGREEDGVLNGVETGAREGGRVVALMVELVYVLVKEKLSYPGIYNDEVYCPHLDWTQAPAKLYLSAS